MPRYHVEIEETFTISENVVLPGEKPGDQEGRPFVRVEFASDLGRAHQSAALYRSKPHHSSVEIVEAHLVKVTGRNQDAAL